jgi:hypothetical protein
MSTQVPRLALVFGACLLASLAPTTTAAAKKDKTPALAAYSGHTINTNPGALRGGNFVSLEIRRLTTDEERQALIDTLASKGSDALVTSMRDSKESVGWVRLPGTTSYDLKYARQVETDKGLQVVVATDRPVGTREAAFNARTMDYGLTLVAFLMPADGSPGQGEILVGAELELDANGQLTITNAAMNPVRFNNIKQTK